MVAAGLATRTRRDRMEVMQRFAGWLWNVKHKGVAEADTGDVEAWLAALPVKPATKHVYLASLRSYYRYCHERGLIEKDPTVHLRARRPGPRRPRPVDPAELGAAWSTATNRLRCWIGLAAFCGLRCMEIATARGENLVQHPDGVIRIHVDGKGRRQRAVPVPSVLLAELQVHGVPRNGWMFRSFRTGSHVTPRTVGVLIARHFRTVGSNATAHMLRHYYACALYQDTSDLLLVQELLGHSSPTVTAVYAASSMEGSAEAAERIAARAVIPRAGRYEAVG